MRRRWLWVMLLVFAGCDGGAQEDAGVVDAGRFDAGRSDAGRFDAGRFDAGRAEDAGMSEAGVRDAGASDGGMSDAGPNGGDTCAMALDVTAGGTFTGTTDGAGDDYSISGDGCPAGGAASGPDVAYLVRPTADTTYRVTVTPIDTELDPMLLALLDCEGSACEEGTILNGPGQQEQITIDVAADETMYVVVDGEVFTSGAFTLDVVIE
jgi:hypothetical protein